MDLKLKAETLEEAVLWKSVLSAVMSREKCRVCRILEKLVIISFY